MSHPNPTGNGCTLEDCYTNLFVLTDLCGIRWRRLIVDNAGVDQLDDPVLTAYTKCLQNDILCVWRRVLTNSEHRLNPSDHLSYNKELWVFWYGDPPSYLNDLLSSDPCLRELEYGSWDRDKDSGLTYECRTLLFKALHNLIERCLLSKNFIRLGKWFVMSPDHTIGDRSGCQLSICFHFFLHGESQVCASIEVKQHPSVWRLTNHHLSLLQDSQASFQVILAPYGLNGTLTGQTFRDSDPHSRHLFQQWSQHYPFDTDDAKEFDPNHLPNLVEVIVAGYRMRYPSAYVFVCDSDESACRLQTGVAAPDLMAGHSHGLGLSFHHSHGPLTPPQSPNPHLLGGGCGGSGGEKIGVGFGEGRQSMLPSIGQVLGHQITEKVAQDSTLTTGALMAAAKRHLDGGGSDDNQTSGMWNFADPATKVICNCVKHRKIRNTTQGKSKSGGKKDKDSDKEKGDKEKCEKDKEEKKVERQQSRHGRSAVPFHRRHTQIQEDVLQFDMDRIMSHLPPNPAFLPTGSTTIPPQGGSTPVPEVTADTPNSAPSPLDPPPNLPSLEPTMPTLSPQPSSKVTGTGGGTNSSTTPNSAQATTPSTSTTTATNNSNSNGSNVVNGWGGGEGTATGSATGGGSITGDKEVFAGNSNDVPAVNTPNAEQTPADTMTALPNGSVNSELLPRSEDLTSGQGAGTPQPCKAASATATAPAAISGAGGCGGGSGGVPVPPDSQLPWSALESAKKELVSNWLQSQQKSVECVLKRPILPSNDSDEESDLVITRTLYDRHSVSAWVHFPLKRSRFEPLPETAQTAPGTSGLEPISPPLPHSPLNPLHHSPSPDPYEFSDEASVNPVTMTTRSRLSRDRQSPRLGDELGEFCQDDIANDMGAVDSPASSTGNLKREKGLQVIGVEKDLARLFESSSSGEEDNDALGMDFPFIGSKGMDEKSCGITLPNENQDMNIVVSVSELTRMFPTPPSLETNKHSPPETATEAPMEVIVAEGPVIKTEVCPPVRPSPPVIPEDCAKFDVFVPSKNVSYISAPKYAPLPSSQLSAWSPLGTLAAEYKPSAWHYSLPLMDSIHPPRTNYVNLPSVEGISSRPLSSPAFAQQQRTPRTPMSYELQSPASTPSSYLNKTLNSIDNTGTNSQLPEVHSLLVNILLSDSILNVFRDYSFDSCNMCVCNIDIRGSDIGLYLPDTGSSSESSYKCACGFSAIINRRFAFNAGLFYEDEVDVTGLRDDRYELQKPPLHQLPGVLGKEVEDIPLEVLNLLMGQFAVSLPNSIVTSQLATLKMEASMSFSGSGLDVMGLRDGNEAVYTTLDVARQAQDNNCYPHKMDDPSMRNTCLHKWAFVRGAYRLPHNSQDIVQCLKSLQPLLQDAIQYKTMTRLWEQTYKLQGPLSWKDFHQLSGRGSVESSEPQPIPQLMVAHDRDWLTISPYTIRFWDKQYLEPFGRPRDIVYIVVAPDSEFLLQHVRNFFRELSTVYELCRLGRHVPIKSPKEGIMRIGKSTTQNISQEPVDDWFSLLGDNPMAAKLKVYAQVLKHVLGPLLVQLNLEKGLEAACGLSHKPQFKTPEPAPSHPPTPEASQSPAPGTTATTPNGTQGNAEDIRDGSGSAGGQAEGSSQRGDSMPETEVCEDNSTMPAVVIYLIDPFSYGQEWSELHRLAMVGLLRCYQQMVLPPNLHNNTALQVIPLGTIMDHKEGSAQSQALKSLAFSIFTACRWNLTHTISGRSLTGFGPCAGAELFLKNKASDSGNLTRLYSPPFIVAPLAKSAAQTALLDSSSEQADRANIMLVAYCLSHDQRFLLAVATNNHGEMLDSCTINIHIPNRNQRKMASARKHGLSKLWDYILGLISMSTRPTRLVIGRLGRMGHGELKGWSGLLGKKNLQAANRRVREMCGQCAASPESPCVRSACVVSMEMNPSFQVMADTLKQEEKQSSSCPLQTPRDASVTHILVFPTSATAQVNANPLQPGDPNNPMDTYDPLDIDDVFPDDDQGMDMGMDFDMDFFDPDSFDPQPGSPGNNQDRGRQHSRNNEPSSVPNGHVAADPQDDYNLLQQPLAMGYYISTAPTGPLPHWLWSSCPENQHISPVCFKASLHINMSSRQWQDELDHSTNSTNRSSHPLDSTLTCDVLRFVLANYNALSWLTYDPVTNDRRSCLPVHKLVLMHMYHAIQTYV